MRIWVFFFIFEIKGNLGKVRSFVYLPERTRNFRSNYIRGTVRVYLILGGGGKKNSRLRGDAWRNPMRGNNVGGGFAVTCPMWSVQVGWRCRVSTASVGWFICRHVAVKVEGSR